MEKNKYWRSKVPVWLVLLFLLNIVAVMAAEVILFYRHPAELTAADLSSLDSIYENSTILTYDEVGSFRCWLVKTSTGDYAVIPAQRHAIISSRANIQESRIQWIPGESGETELRIRRGIHTASVVVTPEPPAYSSENREMYLTILYAGNGSYSAVTAVYMALAAALETLELLLWQLLKKK